MAIRVEVFDSLEAARETWLDAQRRGDLYVFQAYEWLEHWYARIGRTRNVRPCLVAVADESDELLYFFPLAVEKHRFASVLVWLGGELGDYGAPVVVKARGEPAPFAAVWKEVLDRLPPVDAIWLKRIPASINGTPNPMTELACDPYHSRAHATTLIGTWQRFYEAKAGAKTRSTDRRKYRRLSEIGTLGTAMSDGADPAVVRQVTSAVVAQKRERYQEIRARDIFHDENHRDFFARPSELLRRSGFIHFSALTLDGQPITAHWGMVFRRRFYYYMPSFARGPWLRYSPGRSLLFHLFEWCFQNDIEVFDFTVGDEAYKRDWCEQELDLYQYFLARTTRGRLYSTWYRSWVTLAKHPGLLRAARAVRRLVNG